VHKSQLKSAKGQFKIDVMSDQQQKNVTRGGGTVVNFGLKSEEIEGDTSIFFIPK
jgi:hypothetical protein